MKERPILMQAPMVRAILEGRKTQTRRSVKPQPPDAQEVFNWCEPSIPQKAKADEGCYYRDPSGLHFHVRCPYGQPGDRLWVKETWRMASNLDEYSPSEIPEYDRGPTQIRYLADPDPDLSGKTRVSIHMPRWASRITLEITAVRVERLQDITEHDAISEGIGIRGSDWASYDPAFDRFAIAESSYRTLWESINGPGSWAANPWVWAITFKRIKP